MRETVAAVVVSALLGVACEPRTNASAPAAPQPASQTAATTAAAPDAAPAENPRSERKAHEGTRVATARKAKKALSGTGRSMGSSQATDASAPTLSLRQSPPSSY